MRRAAAIVCALGCSNAPSHLVDSHGNDTAAIDTAAIDAPANNVVQMTVYDPLAFVAYRNGSDEWATPPLVADDTYELHVDNDYIVLLVCDPGGSDAFTAEEDGFTFAGDGSAIVEDFGCPNVYPVTVGATTVIGTMKQPGSVQIDGVGSASATGPWTYTITTNASIGDAYTLLAIDTQNRAVFETGTLTGSDLVGPTIDTGSAAPLVASTLTIGGLGASSLSIESSYQGNAMSSGSSNTVLSLPPADLGSDTFQVLDISATDAIGTRFIALFVEGVATPPTSYQLMPDFPNTTVDGVTGSWEALPTSTFTAVAVGMSNATGYAEVTASPSWIGARDAHSLTFDASAPGYRPAWTIDPATAMAGIGLYFKDPTTGIFYSTTPSAGVAAFSSPAPRGSALGSRAADRSAPARRASARPR